MTISQGRYFGVLSATGLVALLSSCSSSSLSTPRAESAELWSAANERYMAGDYLKAISNLESLLDRYRQYCARALPLSLVLTSGVAAGYLDVAESYAAGARANKAKATALKRKASVYRALANHMVLQFAESARRIEQLAGGSVQLAFAPPRGNGAEPPLFEKIASGIEPDQADEETTVALAVDYGVLVSVTNAAGAANNFAKVAPLLQRGEVLVPRATFMKAIAGSLERESQLYARNKLDDAPKLAMLLQLARNVVTSSSHTAAVHPIGVH